MAYGKKPVIVSKNTSFELMVDETCERLMDQQVKYSIQQLNEMENRLNDMERELSAFLLQKNR
ncbi:MAG: hypothetical protein LBH97_02140 [Treponema sp.]|jgi:hypothetical protein|nr:hypothetical protein [Treponema sp.]